MTEPIPPDPQDPSQPARVETPAVPPSPVPAAPLSPTDELIVRSRALEESKRELELKLAESERRLAEEREKVLLASLKTKQEAELAARVEVALKEIQDKFRRDRREEELDKARTAAEARAQEMERLLTEEHETWVSALRDQAAQRAQDIQKVRDVYTHQISEAEDRWVREKADLREIISRLEAELQRTETRHVAAVEEVRREAALQTQRRKKGWGEVCQRLEGLVADMERHFQKRRELEGALAAKDAEIMAARSTLTNLRAQLGEVETEKKTLESVFLREITSLRQGGAAFAPVPAQAQAPSGPMAPAAEVERLLSEMESARRERASLSGALETERRETERLRADLVRAVAEAQAQAASQRAQEKALRDDADHWRARAGEWEKKAGEESARVLEEERIRRELGQAVSGQAAKSLQELESRVAVLNGQNEALQKSLAASAEEAKLWTQRARTEEDKRLALEDRFSRAKDESRAREAGLREEVEREIRRAQEQWERDRRQWAEEAARDAEQKLKDQQAKARREVEELRRRVEEDFSQLERRNRELQREREGLAREKEFLQRSLDDARRQPGAAAPAPVIVPMPAAVAPAQDEGAIRAATALWEERLRHIEERLNEENRLLIGKLQELDQRLLRQRERERELDLLEDQWARKARPIGEAALAAASAAPAARAAASVDRASFLDRINSWLDRAVIELRFDD